MQITVRSVYVTQRTDRPDQPWVGRFQYFTDAEPGKVKTISKTFDPSKVKTKDQAERAKKKWRDEVVAKLSDMPEPKAPAPDATISVAEYVKRITNQRIAAEKLEESTQYSYRFSLAHVERGFSNVALADLKPTDITAWIAEMNEAGLSPATISKAYRLLKQALEIAVEDELIVRNPCLRKAVRLPKACKEQPNVLDASGRTAIVHRLADMERTPTVLAAYIALYTGMRRGEICALTWADVDIDRATISVSKTVGIKQGGTYIKAPKSERGRRAVPMPTQLVPILAAHRAFMHEDWAAYMDSLDLKHDEAAFSKLYVIGTIYGEYRNPTRLGKAWQSLAETFNLIGTQGRIVTLHDLRHTYATVAVASNSDVKSVSGNLGHANTAITLDIYAGDDEQAKRRTAEIVGRAFELSRDSDA